MKFNSSRLKRFNYDISLSFDEAKELKEIVALADNQILRSIRDIKNKTIDYEYLEELYKEREQIKHLPYSSENSHKIKSLQDEINNILFIPEYITVVMDHPKHYDYIYHNGVYINGHKYKRFSCSASQARVSTVVLCDIDIIPELRRRLDNGRNKNIPIAPSKFNAYFGLSSSATHLVSEPKFIVVRDYINQTTFKANFVTETYWDVDDEIDIRDVTLDMTRNDGMGLISPYQSKKWAEELGLDYIPCQWCIRQNYIKGMLCTFDIHDFCEKINGGNYIVDTIYKDKHGNYIKADLRDFDVIITESQFKLWNSWDNINNYIGNCRRNKLYWGVSQYTPKQPKDILTLNYQFLQTLNIVNQTDIEELCSQFVEWIYGVSYDNIAYMLLFLLGVNNTEEKITEFLRSSDAYWIKSLIINHELRNDKYIRGKIHDLIKYKIQDACLGNIIVDGNFQVLVSDPYALMQHVCGLDITGLLSSSEFYSGYWNSRNIRQVDAMRSPLTYRSEHVILDFVKNEQTEYWYKYCEQGIILNWFGHECVQFAGSDFDFDIIATTSNSVMIKTVYRDELPVVYNPPKPQKIIPIEDDLYYADTFAFGSIIGQITNKGSNGYALLPLLKQFYGENSNEYKITESRLKQCCKAQSCQIDKAKIGREVKGIPKIWTIYNKINETDGDGRIKEKEFNNSILLNRYPYFFKYRYSGAKKKYNKYLDHYESNCKLNFQISLSKLLSLENKSEEQIKFISNFYKFMPVTYSNSSMNLICEYIEKINFDIGNKLKVNEFDFIWLYKNNEYTYSNEQYDKIKQLVLNHNKKVSFNFFTVEDDIKEDDDVIQEYYLDNESLFDKISNICSNVYTALNCLIDYFYIENPSSNKDILWGSYGQYICRNIKRNSLAKVLFPFPSDSGNIIYLNKRYKFLEIKGGVMD